MQSETASEMSLISLLNPDVHLMWNRRNRRRKLDCKDDIQRKINYVS